MQRRILAIAVLAATTVVGAGWWAGTRLATAADAPFVASDFEPVMSDLDATNEAIAFYQQRAEDDPYGAAHRATLAGLYLQRARETGDFEDFRRAEAVARRSVELRTIRNSKGYRMLAASLLAQHRFEEAREVAERLVEAWPESGAHRALLGQIQLEMGDYEAADMTLGPIQNAIENLAVAPRLASWAEVSGRDDEARYILHTARDRALERNDLPRETRAWFHLRVGVHELDHGRLDDAEEAFRAGLAIEPNDFRIVSALVRLEALRHEWERAIVYGELVDDAADLETLAIIGDAHAALGDAARAEDYYRRVEESAAETPEPFNRQLHWFRLDHDRRVDESLAVLQDEIQVRRDVYGYDVLAWALYKSGDYTGARQAIARALRLGTEDAGILFRAGMIERALGNRDAARRHLEKALKLNPRFHHRHPETARSVLAAR